MLLRDYNGGTIVGVGGWLVAHVSERELAWSQRVLWSIEDNVFIAVFVFDKRERSVDC